MKNIKYLIIFCLCYSPLNIKAQTQFPLYENGIVPGAILTNILNDTLHGKSWLTGNDTTIIKARTIMPTLTVFRPDAGKNNGIAVLICSGGSYRNVADVQEGIPAAKKLSENGITAFVLHYRVPRSDLMENKTTGPFQDVQKALQFVRENAEKYQLDKNRIGIMGFSAGGHLVSSICTHPGDIYINNPKHTNLRPDFMVLVYPVISFADSLTHQLSRQNLIGPDITPELVAKYSNELHVDANTPPTYITSAIDDDIVKVQNSLLFYAALEQAKVPSNIFLYTKGGHGFGINNHTAEQQWIDPCLQWIIKGTWKMAIQ
ncbi:alpha/beta hydrolase [Chitinophaga sancti]|uniref:alpha/beta hydrolase n=1 Tax=Chitinophaga sancti TaxID=1004 RepID=UPI002A7552A0|nr:alpha/beta hydrolase [Chitinophaga sancti]WPQ63315.1 alpha/beta hydrolase [Chitinophaga sancti]